MSFISRRRALTLLAASAGATLCPDLLDAQHRSRQRKASKPAPAPAREAALPASPLGFPLTREQDRFLDDLERGALLYFLEQSGAATGQVLDRAAFYGNAGKRDPRTNASIAATGFGLTALCIADSRRYLPQPRIRAQVLKTLRYHAEQLPHEHGFFYHFNHVDTGQPESWSEVSSIDTSLLLCGVLTARAHFIDDDEIASLAAAIYHRVDWPWMLNGGLQFSMGWHRTTARESPGFIPSTWNHYCELMMLPLLALGSPTHPVDPSTWEAWSRPTMTYDGIEYIGSDDPLFVHQYSHAWFDFRHRHDRYANYFDNSVKATRAHRAFCLSMGAPYGPDYWGISASDSASGYQAWGGPPPIGRLDGSVVPCAAAGSLPFLPAECLQTLMALRRDYGSEAYNRYGFTDALHPAVGWYNADVLGIDLGIGMLMAENLRTGFVWQTFARNPEVNTALEKAGFIAG